MEKIIKSIVNIVNSPAWISKNNEIIFINDRFEKHFYLTIDDIHNDQLNAETEELINQILINKEENINFIYNEVEYNHRIVKENIDNNEYKIGVLEIYNDHSCYTNNESSNILNTIIDNIPELVFYKDVNGVYRGANKHCIDFYKARGIDGLIGKKDLELNLKEDFIKSCTEHDKIVIETKKPLYIEEEVPAINDDIKFVETIKTPILNDKNEVWGIVGLVRDITESKKKISELKKLSWIDKLTGLYNRAYFDKMIKELDNEENYPLSIIMGDVDGLKVANDAFGHFSGDKLLINMSNVIKDSCRNDDLIFRWGGDEFAIILPNKSEDETQIIKERIKNNCEKAESNPIPLSISLGSCSKKNKEPNIKEIIKIAENELYKQKIRSKEKFCYGEFAISFIVESIKNNLSNRINDIDEHIENTTKYATIIGDSLCFSNYELNELKLAASLHDIGLSTLEEEHLCKSMLETDKNDIGIISDHTEKGFRIIKSYSNLEEIAKIILNHHENWDGTGYPFGIKGENIPINARIIHLASDLDILMRKNKEKNPLTFKEDSLKEVLNEKSKAFDPNLVDILVLNYEKI